MARIKLAEDLLLVFTSSTLPDGSSNPMFPLMQTLSFLSGAWETEGGLRVSPKITRYDIFTPAVVAQIFGLASALGGSVEVVGYPTFVTLDAAGLAAAVPSYMPNATYTDDADVEQTRTWEEYSPGKDLTPLPDGSIQIELNGFDSKGWLPASTWVQLLAAGFNVQPTSDWVSPPSDDI